MDKAALDRASVDSPEQLASRASSDILSVSTSTCIADVAVKDQEQGVLFSQDNGSSCVSKDDGEIVTSSDHLDDANHKDIKYSAGSISNFCLDGSEICINGHLAGSGLFNQQFLVEGYSGQAVLETVGFLDRVDSYETSGFRDELSGGTLSKGAPSECSMDQAESSSVKMPDLQNIDQKFNGESCVAVKPKTESNDDALDTPMLITNEQEPPVKGHIMPDTNGSDELVDVRVCDICGDVGREALLALCSKCSDGAEHIYCMRIKMDEVPERDWVCEGCVLQEPKRLKPTEAEGSDSTRRTLSLEEITQGLPTIHQGVWNVAESKTNHYGKRPCLSAKRPAEDMELKSAPKRRALEKGIQLQKSHFGKKTVLPQVSSLNITGKSEYGGPLVSSLGNQSSGEGVESTNPLSGHGSPKHGFGTEARSAPRNVNVEKRSQPPISCGSGRKSMLTRVSSLKMMNKGKGASYRRSSSGIQSSRKDRELEILPSGHRSPKSELHCPPLKSSSVPAEKSQLTLVSSVKMTDKGEGACFQESSHCTRSPRKDMEQKKFPSSDRSARPEPQFQALKSTSTSRRNLQLTRVSSLKTMYNDNNAPGQESCYSSQSVKQEEDQASPLPGHRSKRHRQECHAGSLKGKATKNADSNNEVRCIHEDVSLGSNAKGSATHKLKSGRKLCKSLSFCGERSVFTAVSIDHCAHASNNDKLRQGYRSSSTESRSALLGLPSDDFDSVKGDPSSEKLVSETLGRPYSSSYIVKNTGIHADGNSGLETLASVACNSLSHENALGKTAQKADLGCPSGIAAVPESKSIWKGAFQLEGGGKLPKYCHGIQAHLSTCASPKVLELVPKCHPDELILKVVPRLDTWPVQFQNNCPIEQDIALYFFAEDSLSHARNYMMLLEGMIRDDLALEANLDGVQLVVFPSSLLPDGSQRWNDLFFLWGVFRVRKVANHSLHICSTIDNSTKEPESVNATELKSQSLMKSINCRHAVSSVEKYFGTQSAEEFGSCKDTSTRLGDHDIRKGNFPESCLHSNNSKKEDGALGYSNPETHVLPISWSGKDNMVSVPNFLQEEKMIELVSGSSFSKESGPSGSSDGAGFAKSDEAPVDQFQDLSSRKNLNLDLCLRPMSEPDINLDLVLGSPHTSNYKVKHFSNDRNIEHRNVSLHLSLGLPCSNR